MLSDSIPVLSINAERVALAIIANAVMPETVALGMNMTNRFILPAPLEGGGTEAHSGWQSLSRWAPSMLTRLTDQAAAKNNELPRRGNLHACS